MRFILIVLFLFATKNVHAQIRVKGKVVERTEKGKIIPLFNANVYWMGGVEGTFTDEAGDFEIPFKSDGGRLIISSVGYRSDTLVVNRPNLGNIILYSNMLLDEVVVSKQVAPIQKSLFKVQNV